MTGENKVDIEQLIEDFQTSRDKQQRAIFASLYIFRKSAANLFR